MVKENIKDNNRLNFFSNRIVNNWNSLPTEIVEANTVNSFKAKLDKLYEINSTYESMIFIYLMTILIKQLGSFSFFHFSFFRTVKIN